MIRRLTTRRRRTRSILTSTTVQCFDEPESTSINKVTIAEHKAELLSPSANNWQREHGKQNSNKHIERNSKSNDKSNKGSIVIPARPTTAGK